MQEVKETQRRPKYLVLGGSAGIGFAFARLRARAGSELVIVARGQTNSLKRIGDVLHLEGAQAVSTIELDLLNVSLRRRFFQSLAHERRFDGIFVGGPSPPFGSATRVTAAMAAAAFEIVIVYPLDAINLAQARLRYGGALTILSSSASKEPLLQHQFFLSAMMRRTLDTIVDEVRPSFVTSGRNLHVWRPKVVLTDLSASFARKQAGLTSKKDILAWLKINHAEATIPTALGFVKKIERDQRVKNIRALP